MNNAGHNSAEFVMLHRIQEQQVLRELNTRFRNVLQNEHENTSELKKSLVGLQTSVATTFIHNQKLESKLEKTWELIAINRNKGGENTIPTELADELPRAYASVMISVGDLVLSKLEKKKQYEEEAEKISLANTELVDMRDGALKLIDKLEKELKKSTQHTAAKDMNVEKLKSQYEVAVVKRKICQDRVNEFGEEGVEKYYENATLRNIAAETALVDTKYKAIYEGQQKKTQEQCNLKYALKKQVEEQLGVLNAIPEQQMKVTTQCDALSTSMGALQREVETAKELQQELELKIDELQQAVIEKAKELQAAVVLKVNTAQDCVSLDTKINMSMENIGSLKEQLASAESIMDEQRTNFSDQREDIETRLRFVQSNLQDTKQRISEAKVVLNSEINKYKGLVEVAEINFSPSKRLRIA